MSVSIRLQRHGATHAPFYKLVAADSRKPRDGRFLEKLGYYDPKKEPSQFVVDADRLQYWYKHGARPSNTVEKLLKVNNIKLSRK